MLFPLKNEGYWCTPVNSVAFAATGGDGVHFSFLSSDGKYSDNSPVVMTVPMCDTPNLIVGENLIEFLALGSKFGYFSLEQLIYEQENTLKELAETRYHEVHDHTAKQLLEKITKVFKLSTWSNPKRRLEELQERYAHLIQLPKEI